MTPKKLLDTKSQIDEKRLIRLREVLRIVGASRSSWYAWIAAGSAPHPIALGDSTSRAWLLSDVLDWVDQQVEKSRAGAA